jgi:hypothetical protein
MYQGFNIFTLAGMEKFAADFAAVKRVLLAALGMGLNFPFPLIRPKPTSSRKV